MLTPLPFHVKLSFVNAMTRNSRIMKVFRELLGGEK